MTRKTQPKGTCPHCRRRIAINAQGLIVQHKDPNRRWEPGKYGFASARCPGTYHRPYEELTNDKMG